MLLQGLDKFALEGLQAGKRWARGYSTSSRSISTNTWLGGSKGGSTVNILYSLVVSGLDFLPSFVIIQESNYGYATTIFSQEPLFMKDGDGNANTIMIKDAYWNANSWTPMYVAYNNDTPYDGTNIYVRKGGFDLPVGLSSTYAWIAIE